jgi:hypothetical protein
LTKGLRETGVNFLGSSSSFTIQTNGLNRSD